MILTFRLHPPHNDAVLVPVTFSADQGEQHLARSIERRFIAFRTVCRSGKEGADFFCGIVDLFAGVLDSRAFFSKSQKYFERFGVFETTELRSFADHFIDRALQIGFLAAYLV